jgi:HrpA-like RNA helicase
LLHRSSTIEICPLMSPYCNSLAVSSLVEVKALTANEDITPMGRLLSKLPMDVHLGLCPLPFGFLSVPRLKRPSRSRLPFFIGKFLLVAALFKCLDPALTIAATLNSKSPFVAPFGLEQEADRAKASFKTGSPLLDPCLLVKLPCADRQYLSIDFSRQQRLPHPRQRVCQLEASVGEPELRQGFLQEELCASTSSFSRVSLALAWTD